MFPVPFLCVIPSEFEEILTIPKTESPVDTLAITTTQFKHELRTPINHIVGYSEMMLEELRFDGDPYDVKQVEQEHEDHGADHYAVPRRILQRLQPPELRIPGHRLRECELPGD